VVGAWSPDDKVIAFVKNNVPFLFGKDIGNIAPSSVWLARADGGNPVRLTDDTHLNTSPVWTPDGAILYVSSLGGNRDIYMRRVSSDLSPRGEPVRLTTGLNAHTISIDRAGKTIAYSVFNTIANVWSTPIPSAPTESPRLTAITTGSQTVENADVSSDGQWLLYDSNLNGNQDIYKVRITGGEPQQLTHNGADNFSAVWSPDGRQIAFHSLERGNRDIYVMDTSGANAHAIAATPSEERGPVWSADGKQILYLVDPDSIYEINREGNGWGRGRLLVRASYATFSRDGRQMVVGVGPDMLCKGCAEGLYTRPINGTQWQQVKLDKIEKVLANPGSVAWTTDSRHAFLLVRERDGTSSIWQLPLNGDPEIRLVHFTDPARQIYRESLSVDSHNFYFTLGDRQSDIWTMELKKQ